MIIFVANTTYVCACVVKYKVVFKIMYNLIKMRMKKFTLLLSMLVAFTATAVAQIYSLDELSNDKAYWFKNYYSENGYEYYQTICYEAEYPEQLWCAYVLTDEEGNTVADDITNVNQHFAILQHEGKMYLYSIAAKKFIKSYNDGLWLTDEPYSYVEIKDTQVEGNTTHPFCFAMDGYKLFGPYPFSGYSYCGYIYGGGSNYANAMYSWAIYEAGDFDSTEAMAALVAGLPVAAEKTQAAKDSLYAAIEAAHVLIDEEAGYSVMNSNVQLQIADPDAPGYIWCNEPEVSEGPIEYLVDGITDVATNFFHSSWSTVVESVHYLEVDLGEGNEISNFMFGEHTRHNVSNDYPATVTVLGSNDGIEYTQIAVVTGLPQSGNTSWESAPIEADQPYRYLRFNVVTGTNRVYFHMAEFWLKECTVEFTGDESYATVTNELFELNNLLEDAEAVYDSETSMKDDYEIATASLLELIQYIADIMTNEPDAQTLALVEEAKALLNVPREFGYPGEESRSTLQAVIDTVLLDPNARQREVMEAAIDAFYTGTDIITVEDGKKYVFTFVSRVETFYYMNRIEEEDILVDSEGNDSIAVTNRIMLTAAEPGVAYPETAAFTSRHNEDGTVSFIADNGMFVIYSDGTSSAAGNAVYGIQVEDDDYAKIQLIRVVPTSNALAENYEDFWGYCAWYSKRNEARGYGVIVSKTDGTGFDGASAAFYNDNYTSVLKVEEYIAGETAIEAVENAEANDGVIYDLTGRRVQSVVAPGIYIVNGTKKFVK